MRRFVFFLSLFIAPLHAHSHSHSDSCCAHSHSSTRDNFLGSARFIINPLCLSECAGVAFLAETGYNNYRLSGTVGFISGEQNRFKVSGEYLMQKLHYDFCSGNAHRWVRQYALGGTHQYLFDDCDCFRGIQTSVNYSQARNEKLSLDHCGHSHDKIERRIAGSWNLDFEAGLIVAPWECSNFIFSVGYDQLQYKRKLSSKHRVSGFAATVELQQWLGWGFALDAKFEYKRPYNYLEALINWTRRYDCGDLSLGIFAAHLWGKEHLLSSSAAGVEMRWSWGIQPDCVAYDNCCSPCCEEELALWLSKPAVYIPVVLAISEEKVCPAPSGSPIENFTAPFFGTVEYDVSDSFDGHGSSVKFSSDLFPDFGFINPKTGVFTITNQCYNQTFDVTVKGKTRCGSVSETFVLTLPCNF